MERINRMQLHDAKFKSSTCYRLYAEGVDLLVHKDHVFSKCGIAKSISEVRPATSNPESRTSKQKKFTVTKSRSFSAKDVEKMYSFMSGNRKVTKHESKSKSKTSRGIKIKSTIIMRENNTNIPEKKLHQKRHDAPQVFLEQATKRSSFITGNHDVGISNTIKNFEPASITIPERALIVTLPSNNSLTNSPRRTSCSVIDPSMRKRTSVILSKTPEERESPQKIFASKLKKLMEQMNVLKSTYGLTDEEIQWRVESSKGNAYLAADKHLDEAEERYDRLVYETMMLSQTPCEEVSMVLTDQLRELGRLSLDSSNLKPILSFCQAEVNRLKRVSIEARIATELNRAMATEELNEDIDIHMKCHNGLEQAKSKLLEVQDRIKSRMSSLNEGLLNLSLQIDTLARACADFKFMSGETAKLSDELLSVLRWIPESSGERLVRLCEDAILSLQKLSGTRSKQLKQKEEELTHTIKNIELWKTRRQQAKEYPQEMIRREIEWRTENFSENTRCLKLMRSLVPHDIQLLSVEAIIERSKLHGVLYTYDLANYIKQNRLLHWLITHESDIARDNFLAVESVQFFANFTALDITELRSLAHVLPESFEFDKDGKKLEWHVQFLDHVHSLVRQQKGDRIKVGWDPIRGCRGETQLKPLTEKQLLNPVYRYPTEDEIQTRIEKFELQMKRIAQKREKLMKLNDEEIPQAKAEYLAIADDARSEELLKALGKSTLIKLRDDAKSAYQALVKTRDVVRSEIDHAQRLANSASPTYEQYLLEISSIRMLDPLTRSNRIKGPFPDDIDLKPKERTAFKKLSVEEEAHARKLELDNAIAERGREQLDGEKTLKETSPSQSVEIEIFSCKKEIENIKSSTADSEVKGPFRRVKSLKVSLEVLHFLENDLCSPVSNRRFQSSQSFDLTHVKKDNVLRGDDALLLGVGTIPTSSHCTTEIRQPPKSRIVRELLEGKTARLEEENLSRISLKHTHAIAPLGRGPSFLQELKSLRNQRNGDPVSLVKPPPPKNFLEELRARSRSRSEEV